jgi:hypothetical protein
VYGTRFHSGRWLGVSRGVNAEMGSLGDAVGHRARVFGKETLAQLSAKNSIDKRLPIEDDSQ